MSYPFARRLLLTQVALLLFGTLMPGAWREGIENGLHASWGLSSWAHLALFLSMTWLAKVPPLAWPLAGVILAALALALLTEGLQFFAVNRHPRWLDVGIDLTGTALGLLLAYRTQRKSPR